MSPGARTLAAGSVGGDRPAGGVHTDELLEGELGRLLCSLSINAAPVSSAADASRE